MDIFGYLYDFISVSSSVLVSIEKIYQTLKTVFNPISKHLYKIINKPNTTHNSLIRSDEWLMLDMSAFESLYGGQFTLATQLIKLNYLVTLPTNTAPQFL